MAKTSKKAIGAAMAGVMAVGAVAGAVQSVNVANAAESAVLKETKANVQHLINSLNNNYAGVKNQVDWEIIIKKIRSLVAKLPAAEKAQAAQITAQTDKLANLVLAIANINHTEKSYDTGYKGIKNVPQWEANLNAADKQIKSLDTATKNSYAKYGQLIERYNEIKDEVQEIADKYFNEELPAAEALYEAAAKSKNLADAQKALAAAEALGTHATSDELEAKVKALIAEINAEPGVSTINAANGTLTVVMSKTPEQVPTINDFKIVQNINGKTTAVNATGLTWNADTKTASLVVPTIKSNEVDQNVSYTVQYKETAVKSSNSFTVAKVTEVSVSNVSVINSKKVKVDFNQEVDKASAETLANYKWALGSVTDATIKAEMTTGPLSNVKLLTNATVKLQDDKKSVIVEFGTAVETGLTATVNGSGYLINNTDFKLVVDGVYASSGKKQIGYEVKPFRLNDAAGPVVKSVKSVDGKVEIEFDEHIDTTSVANNEVILNGVGLNVADLIVGKDKITIPAAIVANKAKVQNGQATTLAIKTINDVYANELRQWDTAFTYSTSGQAPSVVDVKAISENKFEVVFSEAVYKNDSLAGSHGAALDAANFVVTKASTGDVLATTVAVKADSKNTVYTVTLSNIANDGIYDRVKNETSVGLNVLVKDYEDEADYIGAQSTRNVTLAKDVTAPTVDKVKNTDTNLDVTFNEGLSTITDANIASKIYATNDKGQKIDLVAGNFTTINPGDKVLKFTNTAGTILPSGNYTLHIPAGTLKDQALNGGNANAVIAVPFSIAAGIEEKPEIVSIDASTTAGVIKVGFAKEVTKETAFNYQNYKIDNATIPSNSEFLLDSTSKIVTITLPEATIKKSGYKTIEVANVRNIAGVVMDAYKDTVNVKENEKVKVTGFQVASNDEIIVTFNEDVNNDDNAPGVIGLQNVTPAGDFALKVNGTVVTLSTFADYDELAGTDKAIAKNQLRIKTNGAINLAGIVTFEVLSTNDVTDAAGNKLVVDNKLWSVNK